MHASSFMSSCHHFQILILRHKKKKKNREYVIDSTKSSDQAKKIFLSEVFEKTMRLSYYEMLKKQIPPQFHVFFPPKPETFFPYSDSKKKKKKMKGKFKD